MRTARWSNLAISLRVFLPDPCIRHILKLFATIHNLDSKLDEAFARRNPGGVPRLNPMIQKHGRNASARLQDLLIHNRLSGKGGVYAVCSAHPWVIDAAIHQAMEDDSFLHVESTSSQMNQLGGYSRKTPSQFADFVHAAVGRMGLPEDRILLGGDHLGPFPWRTEASNSALSKARELARVCVLAGYRKIHLDASMHVPMTPRYSRNRWLLSGPLYFAKPPKRL